MFKANRLLGIIILFLFVVIMGSCGGGGGGNGGTFTQPSEPTPPPPQTSITDDSGQATFLTSQGQTVTFEVKDNNTQQPLANISVTFMEGQDNIGISNIIDPNGTYMPTIHMEPLPASTTSSQKLSAQGVFSDIKNFVIDMIPFNDLPPTIIKYYQGVNYLIKLGGDFNSAGILYNIACIPIRDYIKLKEQLLESEDLTGITVDTGIDLGELVLDLGTKVTILLNVVKGVFNPIEESMEEVTLEYLYAAGIIDEYDWYNLPHDELLNMKIKIEYYIIDTSSPLLACVSCQVPRVVLRPLPADCPDSVPPAPTTLKATPISPTQIDLSWDDVSRETGYIIEYSVDGTFDPLSACVRINTFSINDLFLSPNITYNYDYYTKGENATSYSHTSLSPNTTYYYRICAVNSAGSSGYSNVAQATTLSPADTIPPSIPTNLTATAVSSSQINLLWNAFTDNVGVAGYKIYRNGSYLRSVTGTLTSDTGLNPSTQYCYRVSAFDTAGNESGQSSQACAITPSVIGFLLSVNKTGSGIISSSPAGINCGSDCSETYAKETRVNLTATADDGWVITGWTDNIGDIETQLCQLDLLSKDGPTKLSCAVTMNLARTITVTFTRGGAITVTKIGSGTVSSLPGGINCGCDCRKVFYGNSRIVTLTANPAIGATFIGWEGDCFGTGNCVLDTSLHRNVIAKFAQGGQYTLAVNKNGSGSVTSAPVGIDCGIDCSEVYNDGTQVTLAIIAGSGWNITGLSFSGSCATISQQLCEIEVLRSPKPTTLSCTLDMVEEKTVTITFAPK
jgi:chitodextrinase